MLDMLAPGGLAEVSISKELGYSMRPAKPPRGPGPSGHRRTGNYTTTRLRFRVLPRSIGTLVDFFVFFGLGRIMLIAAASRLVLMCAA